jgi:LmbE family N-acetylglucosaminyl deacetylase
MKKIMVVSPHPDDEILGAGGTLLRHKRQGDEINWLIVTNISEDQGFSKDRVMSRQNEIRQIALSLLIKETVTLNYPTATLDTTDLVTLIPKISEVFNKIQPEIIYCANRSDVHSDHRVIFEAVMACTKSFRYPFIREIMMYECISETEFAPALPENIFQPNCFVDISEEMAEKIQLMQIYRSEMEEHPFPRSERNMRALATYRGAMTGVEYSEAFQLIKSLRIEKV